MNSNLRLTTALLRTAYEVYNKVPDGEQNITVPVQFEVNVSGVSSGGKFVVTNSPASRVTGEVAFGIHSPIGPESWSTMDTENPSGWIQIDSTLRAGSVDLIIPWRADEDMIFDTVHLNGSFVCTA